MEETAIALIAALAGVVEHASQLVGCILNKLFGDRRNGHWKH
jgi:hypothetical protein